MFIRLQLTNRKFRYLVVSIGMPHATSSIHSDGGNSNS
jgi:hypothetical protein